MYASSQYTTGGDAVHVTSFVNHRTLPVILMAAAFVPLVEETSSFFDQFPLLSINSLHYFSRSVRELPQQAVVQAISSGKHF